MTTSIESIDATTSRVLVGGVESFQLTAEGISKVQDASITEAKLATAVKPLGVSQTWQNLVGSRLLGTTYTNSTGRPICIAVCCYAGSASIGLVFTINGLAITVAYSQANGVGGVFRGTSAQVVIPTGATYNVTVSGGVLDTWYELR